MTIFVEALGAGLALLLLAATVGVAYVKIGLVLGVLRQGLGAGLGVPPAVVTAGLALLLSLLVMAPVASQTLSALPARMPDAPVAVVQALQPAAAPLRTFLVERTPAAERALVLELAQRVRAPAERSQVADTDLLVLLPAFTLSELTVAFQISFLLLLPFLVLELLAGALLQGFGLWGLSAAAVALPFKLLLFLLCDGWHLLVRGLLLGAR